jgi:hypothetical protein
LHEDFLWQDTILEDEWKGKNEAREIKDAFLVAIGERRNFSEVDLDSKRIDELLGFLGRAEPTDNLAAKDTSRGWVC